MSSVEPVAELYLHWSRYSFIYSEQCLPVSAPFGRGQTMHSLGCFAAAYVFATSEFRGEGCVCMLSVVLQILQRVQSYAARKIVRIGKDEHMSACAA